MPGQGRTGRGVGGVQCTPLVSDCKSEKKKGLEGKRKEKERGKGKEGGNIEKGKRKREKERVKK